jgi:PAS domain S-box-containing protein
VTLLEEVVMVQNAQETVDILIGVLQSSTAYAVVGMQTDGTIQAWNDGAQRLYGYAPDEVIDKANAALLDVPEDGPASLIHERMPAARRHGTWQGRCLQVRQHGGQFLADLTLLPRCDATGRLRGFLLIATDIAEPHRSEEALQRCTADLEVLHKELDAFSYSVSHDLRAPLRSIDGFSRILLEDYAAQLDPQAQRFLRLVHDNAQQMAQLIDDLLHFARLSRQPLAKRWMNPTALVRQTLSNLRGAHAGRPVQATVADLPCCEADPALLEQLFMHLLANALKYTRQRQVAQIDVGFLPNAEAPGVPIYFVKDNGVGFNMQYADRLFGMFQRLHRAEEYEGTGVGLAMVQRIVHRHGGRIWADAEVDKGATFYFTLGGGLQHVG